MRSPLWSVLREFIRDPISTGTVCSSSPSLCKAIAENTYLPKADVVVELGSGTGCISEHLLKAIKPDADFLSVEKNPFFYQMVISNYPGGNFLLGNAEDLPQILDQQHLDKADVIISSLPWAAFAPAQQERITNAIRLSLKPNGVFITYAYISGALFPSFKAFRENISERFQEVQTSKIIWRNFPPAFVYQCRVPVPLRPDKTESKESSSSPCN